MEHSDKALDAALQIDEDLRSGNGPFDKDDLPEKAALEHIDQEDHLNFLSFGVSLDYNRNAAQLWDNCIELYERHGSDVYNPESAVRNFTGETATDLSKQFADIGFRYPNRDAQGWIKNARIVGNYDEGWQGLINHAQRGDGAPKLVELLREHEFMYLKGEKLAPFYAKVINAEICVLDNMWELDIPVDTHVRNLTQDLIETGKVGSYVAATDPYIRKWWKELGQEYDIDVMTVDTGLWLIGNNWNDWGEQYWEDLLE